MWVQQSIMRKAGRYMYKPDPPNQNIEENKLIRGWWRLPNNELYNMPNNWDSVLHQQHMIDVQSECSQAAKDKLWFFAAVFRLSLQKIYHWSVIPNSVYSTHKGYHMQEIPSLQWSARREIHWGSVNTDDKEYNVLFVDDVIKNVRIL